MELLFLLLISSYFVAATEINHTNFPVSSSMRIQVNFWKKIYTEITSEEGVIHDSNDLTIIFEKISLSGMSRKQQNRLVKGRVRQVQEIFKQIYKKKAENLSDEQKKFYELAHSPNLETIHNMTKKAQIRFQRGMKDRYYEGLVRSQG